MKKFFVVCALLGLSCYSTPPSNLPSEYTKTPFSMNVDSNREAHHGEFLKNAEPKQGDPSKDNFESNCFFIEPFNLHVLGLIDDEKYVATYHTINNGKNLGPIRASRQCDNNSIVLINKLVVQKYMYAEVVRLQLIQTFVDSSNSYKDKVRKVLQSIPAEHQ